MSGVVAAVRRANRTGRAEDDVVLRWMVLACVLLAVLAVVVTGTVPVADGVAALVLLPVGAWWSHRHRGDDNTALKALLALGAGLALWRFFDALARAQTVDEARLPLTQLFLAVQVFHGADLPARRDLGFTLASSLALVALAGASLQESAFALILLTYTGLVGFALVRVQRSAALETADALAARAHRRRAEPDPGGSPDRRLTGPAWVPLLREVARAAVPVALVTALIFSLLPTAGRSRLSGLPFAGLPGPELPTAGVVNPGLPFAGAEEGAVPDGGYFGFAETVDLRSSPQLSDEPVLRLRMDRPRLLRGVVFDRYDGSGWARTAPVPDPIRGIPVALEVTPRPAARLRDLVVTVEVLRETPNLVFAPPEATAVWLSAGAVSQWDDGTLTTSATLDEGIVYSVSSLLDRSEARTLAAVAAGPDDQPPGGAARWLQLPPNLPDRVHDLAATLTSDRTTPWAKADALQDWLGEHTVYRLGADPLPPGGDVADHFLFTTREGWCEPIATAMVVLLRAAGVPARFATGFQPGERNPLTGRWTVRGSDAHAWAEAWVPGHGWVAFDATRAVPAALDPEATEPRVPLIAVLQWFGEHLRELVPERVRAALLGGPGRAAALSLLVFATVVAMTLWWFVRLRRRQDPPAPFQRLAAGAGAAGLAPQDWQTPREWVTALRRRRPDLPEAPLAAVLADEEARRYRPAAARGDPHQLAESVEALIEVLGSPGHKRRRGRRRQKPGERHDA